MTDGKLEKWKVSRITAITKIKSAWGVRSWAELAGVCNEKSKSVKKFFNIRSDSEEIKKSCRTGNTNGKFPLFLRSVHLSFRTIFTHLQKGNC